MPDGYIESNKYSGYYESGLGFFDSPSEAYFISFNTGDYSTPSNYKTISCGLYRFASSYEAGKNYVANNIFISSYLSKDVIDESVNVIGDESKAHSLKLENKNSYIFCFRILNVIGVINVYNNSYSLAFNLGEIVENRISSNITSSYYVDESVHEIDFKEMAKFVGTWNLTEGDLEYKSIRFNSEGRANFYKETGLGIVNTSLSYEIVEGNLLIYVQSEFPPITFEYQFLDENTLQLTKSETGSSIYIKQ